MSAPVSAAGHPAVAQPAATSPHAGQHLSFGDVLSVLNPLQYVPVVGTIYRAITGDTIPEPIRQFGSIIVSGLMGGPVGIAISVLTTAAEEVTGIDPDRIGQALLHGKSLGAAIAGPAGPATPQSPSPRNQVPATAQASPSPRRVTQGNRGATGARASPITWTAAKLAADGTRADAAGTMHKGAFHGPDALNAPELAQLDAAQAAYARTASLTR